MHPHPRSSVVVQWVSADGGTQSVQYGSEGSDLQQQQQGTLSVDSEAATYRPEDMCGFPADSVGWIDPGFM